MYKISFETNKANKKVSNWEDKLFNDFHKKINDITYEYKTESKVLKRLDFIINSGYSKVSSNKDSYIHLYYNEYGNQELAVKLWGIPQGYVNIYDKLLQAEKDGIVRIRLSDFYDIRQNSKSLKNSYLVIEYKK